MVVIDDFIPCKNKEPVFSSANGNELWVILLEKAWAKLHGSYERIIGGQSHLTFRDLTGAPSFEFETKDEDAWDRILDGDKKDFIMAAGIAQDDEEEAAKLKALGLVGQHSYGLIAVAEVTDQKGKQVKLVQLRNPWGNFEWMGDWGDTSKCWTEKLKKQLNHTEDATDGTFWMSFTDFSTYFSRIQMCKYIDNCNFVNLVSQRKDFHVFQLTVNDSGFQTISVSQKDERCFDRYSKYVYSNCRVMLVKCESGEINDGDIQFIQGTKGYQDRDTYIEIENCQKGKYYVFVEMDWDPYAVQHPDDAWFSLTCYGPGSTGIRVVTNYTFCSKPLHLCK